MAPRSSPAREASTSTSASAATSRTPRLKPWPAIGGCRARIAGQREAIAHIGIGQHHGQRIGEAQAERPHLAEARAEAPLDLLAERRVIELQQHRHQARILRPHDGGAVSHAAVGQRLVGHRQHRERTGRQEVLVRHPAMRLLMRDRAHDRGLAVAELARRDPRHAAQRPIACRRPRPQLRRQHAAVSSVTRAASLASSSAVTTCGARWLRFAQVLARSSSAMRVRRFSMM